MNEKKKIEEKEEKKYKKEEKTWNKRWMRKKMKKNNTKSKKKKKKKEKEKTVLVAYWTLKREPIRSKRDNSVSKGKRRKIHGNECTEEAWVTRRENGLTRRCHLDFLSEKEKGFEGDFLIPSFSLKLFFSLLSSSSTSFSFFFFSLSFLPVASSFLSPVSSMVASEVCTWLCCLFLLFFFAFHFSPL